MRKILSYLTALSILLCSVGNIAVHAAEQTEGDTVAVEISDKWTLDDGAEITDGRIHLPKGEASRAYIDIPLTEKGYYNVSANVYAESCDGIAYLYGEGDGYSSAKTSVMMSADINTPKTVTVKSQGAKTSLRIGIGSDGTKDIYADSFKYEQTDEPYEFLQGGDITMIRYVLSHGGNYRDSDGNLLYNSDDDIEVKIQKVINYLANRGMNFCRIRLTNNPGVDGELMHPDDPADTSRFHLPAGYQDEADCLALAEYAHNAGMKIQFTFNISDYWSNNHQQYIPVDWQEKIEGKTHEESVEILTQCVSDYVTDIMTKLAAIGVYPEYVSIGNEISGGILYPHGYSYDTSADDATDNRPEGTKDWSAIVSFLNAGYDAVKEVSADSKVIIHLEDMTGDYASHPDDRGRGVFWWFNDFQKAGGKWDVTGISYYPAWSAATIDDCAAFGKALGEFYEKPVIIMESGYEWNDKRKDGYNGQLHEDEPVYKDLYSSSQSGQKGFVSELLAKSKSSDSIIGSLYWDPMMIHVEDKDGNNITGWAHYYDENGNDVADVNVVENTTLFDFEGKATTALEAYEYNTYSKPLTQISEIVVYAGYDENGVLKAVQVYDNENEFDPTTMEGLRIKILHFWK